MIDAFRRRFTYYAIFAVIFAGLYTGVVVWLGEFPTPLLFGVLGLSVAKDVYDEYRIRRGEGPLWFVGVEHVPSNLVLSAFLLAGVVAPAGSVTVPNAETVVALSTLAVGIAVADTVLDLSQDLREA